MIFYRSFHPMFPQLLSPTTKQLSLRSTNEQKNEYRPRWNSFSREISRWNFPWQLFHAREKRTERVEKSGRRGRRGGRKIDNATTRIQLTLPTEVCNATCASITRELRFPACFRPWNVSYSARARLEKFSCENCENHRCYSSRIILENYEISRARKPLLIGT